MSQRATSWSGLSSQPGRTGASWWIRLSGVPCQVCRYVAPGFLVQSIDMQSLATTTSASPSAAAASGVPYRIVSTPGGEAVAASSATHSQVWVEVEVVAGEEALVDGAGVVGEQATEGEVDDLHHRGRPAARGRTREECVIESPRGRLRAVRIGVAQSLGRPLTRSERVVAGSAQCLRCSSSATFCHTGSPRRAGPAGEPLAE